MRESTFTLVYWGFIPSFPTKGQLDNGDIYHINWWSSDFKKPINSSSIDLEVHSIRESFVWGLVPEPRNGFDESKDWSTKIHPPKKNRRIGEQIQGWSPQIQGWCPQNPRLMPPPPNPRLMPPKKTWFCRDLFVYLIGSTGTVKIKPTNFP